MQLVLLCTDRVLFKLNGLQLVLYEALFILDILLLFLEKTLHVYKFVFLLLKLLSFFGENLNILFKLLFFLLDTDICFASHLFELLICFIDYKSGFLFGLL